MLDFPRWKIATILIICVLGVYLALPNLFSEEERKASSLIPDNAVQLGLDLRGGSYLLLQVDFDAYFKEQLEQLEDDVRRSLRDGKIRYQSLRSIPSEKAVSFAVMDNASVDTARTAIKGVSNDLETSANGMEVTVTYRDQYIETTKINVLEQSIEIVRRRVDETGTTEPIIQRQGDNRILLQVPGLQDPERLKALLGQTAKMTFHLMHPSEPFPSGRKAAAPGMRLLRGDVNNAEMSNRYFMIQRRAILSGDMLVHASASFDQGRPVVSFRFNTLGGKRFGKITAENVGKPFAIVLDDHVITAPVIQDAILGGQGIITGNFSVEGANDLALLLRAGALPAPLTVVEERTVGPSLGQDSIDAGMKAALLGVVLVIGFMIVSYGLFGVFSTVVLVLNMAFIIAILTLFGATLTLPGIAGMILTMGMAVDANVLIFERIREEVANGKTPYVSIEHGFRQAYKTILDSNITTLIATFLLFTFGSGPVKGFAVTLSAGIVSSMFSAILLTRMMIVIWLRRTKPKTIPI